MNLRNNRLSKFRNLEKTKKHYRVKSLLGIIVVKPLGGILAIDLEQGVIEEISFNSIIRDRMVLFVRFQ